MRLFFLFLFSQRIKLYLASCLEHHFPCRLQSQKMETPMQLLAIPSMSFQTLP